KDTFYPIEKNVVLYERLNKEVYQNISKYTDEVLKKTHAILNMDKEQKPTITSWSQAAKEE
ncbi:MAG: hypothetical protein RR683_07725, partial [Lachnospiraceae bacterium]